jgi:hypothetical protein
MDGSENFSIGHATSTDGITWEKDSSNPVLEVGTAGSWDQVGIQVGSVIFDDDTYHMWYYSWNNSGSVRIGYATSEDGVVWSKYESNPVMVPSDPWENNTVRKPIVLFDGVKFCMWYSGGAYNEWRTGYATSPDGINWTKYVNNPVLDWGEAGSWDDYAAAYCSVLLDTVDNIYKMWYSGSDAEWSYQTGYATAQLNINVPDDYETIQAAINAAQDGNVVLVDEGTYYENINFKGKAITVASHYYMDGDTSHISKTVIDGSQPSNPDSGTVVTFNSGEDTTSVLCGFTITGGSGTNINVFDLDSRSGGGIQLSNGGKIIHNRIINNQILSENLYCYGAGIDIIDDFGMNIIISDNEIRNNTVSAFWGVGAGVCMILKGKLIFERNKVENNIYTSPNYGAGGGIGILGNSDFQGEIIINRNFIKNNESVGGSDYTYGKGGGLYIEGQSPNLINNILTGNKSGKGGGLYISPWFDNVFTAAAPILINNTLTNNEARSGGGIYIFQSNVKIINTILWDNQASVSQSEIFNDESTINVFYSDIKGGSSGEGNIDADPLFVDTVSYNLSELSPCVGSGIDSIQVEESWYYNPTTDISGRQRPDPVDLFVDMGAQESIFPSGMEDDNLDFILTTFSLKQNYPNPFNPVTAIGYQLSATSDVELSIYNLLGQKVVTLVSEKQKAGHHQVEWNASGFASGIYYYKITAGEFQDVKKMILLR